MQIQYSDILNSLVPSQETVIPALLMSPVSRSPQMVMHSILASRIFFNLRETTRREQVNMLPITLTDFRAPAQGSSGSSGSSGFSSSLGSSSSSGGIDLDKVIDIRREVDVPARESVIQG